MKKINILSLITKIVSIGSLLMLIVNTAKYFKEGYEALNIETASKVSEDEKTAVEAQN